MTVNKAYTQILLGIKITCLILSIAGYVFYRLQLRKFGELEIPVDLKVVSLLCLMLIFFNDPLYIFDIFTPNFALSVFSGIFLCSFLTFILFYWLYAFQRSSEAEDYKTAVLTLPKAIFFGVRNFLYL